MLARKTSVGTPGGSRPRTRRSTRATAVATAAASPSSQLLEPAGPVVPAADADPSVTTGADNTESQQGARKRPRIAAVGVFSGDSIDDVALPDADVTAADAERITDPPALQPAPSDRNAPVGEKANESSVNSPPGAADAGTSSDAPQADGVAEEDKPDCGICLETCLHPVKLPCGHIFCYLCVKGAAKQSARCAYCRAEVTEKFIKNPRLLDETEVDRELTDTSSHHWLYQGRHGWWRYDERTSRDIEEAFTAQQPSVQISVAGELYTVEFGSLTQFNDECRGRRRRVRREAANAAPDPTVRCKGVAGLRKKRRRQ